MGGVQCRCCNDAGDEADMQDKGAWDVVPVEHADVWVTTQGSVRSHGSVSPRASKKHPTLNSSRSFRKSPSENIKSDAAIELIVKVMQHNPHFQRYFPLTSEQMEKVAAFAWSEEVAEGDELMHSGDLNSEHFVIVAAGTFEISSFEPFEVRHSNGTYFVDRPERKSLRTQTERIEIVGPNTTLGELSMFFNAPRWGTVTAKTDASVWCIDRAILKHVQHSGKEEEEEQLETDSQPPSGGWNTMRGKVKHTLWLALPPTPTKKDDPFSKEPQKDERWLCDVLRANTNMNPMMLSDSHRQFLANVAWIEFYGPNTVITQEGDLNAETFFIVEKGSVELASSMPFEIITENSVSYIKQSEEKSVDLTVRIANRGTCFGLLAMLHGVPRIFTATALEETAVWCIDRANLREVQKQATQDLIKARVQYLEKMSILESIPHDEKVHIANVLEDVRFVEGEKVMTQGEEGTNFYILTEGKVDVFVDDRKVNSLTADPAKDDVQSFGEKALLDKKPRSATVTVVSPFATGFVLESEDFQMLRDALAEARGLRSLRKAQAQKEEGPQGFDLGTTHRGSSLEPHNITAEHLKCVGFFGKSRLGPVEHCKNTVNGRSYAVRRYYKGSIVNKGMTESVINEKKTWLVAARFKSKFVIDCFAFFNQPQSLLIVLEAAFGGSLDNVYRTKKFFGSEKHTRYYIASVICAVEHLQKTHRILIRNVKPSSILITHEGFARLGNLTLAKVAFGKTYSACGTPDYMAPEVLIGSGYSKGVDWYSVGIMVFELLAGLTPFGAEHPMAVYSNIMRGIQRADFPETMLPPAVNLVKALASFEPVDRIAMRPGGIRKLYGHRWFHNFGWDQLKDATMEPPYVPGTEQLATLGRIKVGKPLPYKDDGSGWDADWE